MLLMFLRVVSVLFVWYGGALQQPGSSFNKPPVTLPPAERLIVPLNYTPASDGTPIVEAQLNNAITVRCMVDTGSNNIFITDTLSAKLRLASTSPVNETDGTVMLNGHARPTMKVRIQMGRFVGTAPCVIVPDAQLRPLVGKNVDMLLGMNVFSATSTLFDFQRHQITLYYPSALSEQELAAVGMQQATILPNVSNRNDAFYVDVTLNDTVKTSLMLDTGAPNTHLSGSVLKPLHLKPTKQRTDFSGIKGDTNQVSLIVNRFAIGSQVLSNQEIFYPHSDTQDTLPELGMDILTHYRILIDYPGKKVYFKPVEPTLDTASATIHSDVTYTAVTLPLEYIERTQAPFVRLTLQDGKPYLFQLDTGATTSYFDRSLTEQAKFTVEDTKDEVGHTLTAFRARLRLSSQVPPATPVPEMPVPLLVEDLADWRTGFPGAAGILGTNVLAQVPWQFDFGKKQVTFFLPDGRPSTLSKPKAALRLPLHPENGFLFVDGEVDGTKTRFLLSTSQNTQLRSSATLSVLHPVGRLEFTKEAAGTVMPQGRANLRDLKVGNLVWKQPVVALLTGEKATQTNILGLDFLRRYRVTVDLQSQSLYLQPDPAYKEVSDAIVNIGVTPRLSADKRVVISYLYLRSPATEAGLQVGDVILSVNGVAATAASFAQILDLLRSPAGTELTLSLQRSGEDKPREVKLKTRKLL